MSSIQGPSVCDVWMRLLSDVMEHGQVCKPRGKEVRELLHTQVTIDDLRNNILTHPARDLNYRFMVAEWLWIQSCRSDVRWIERYNRNIAQFSDDGVTFRGAYGPRLILQIDRVLNLLRKDPDTRQAVITIFDHVDLVGATRDVPCTISLQLLLRAGKLHGVMTMRSNDLWLGFPYDLFNFSQITSSIAGELGVEPGSFTLQAGSSHVYQTDAFKVAEVLKDPNASCWFERSPKLERLAPPEICREVELPGPKGSTTVLSPLEQAYAYSLQCPTKAQCLEVLRTL